MAWQLNEVNDYVNQIIKGEGVHLECPINIDMNSKDIGFKYIKKNNTISLGKNSFTFLLLQIAYCTSPQMIYKIIFNYYFAYDNLINYKFGLSCRLLAEILNDLVKDKKYKKLNKTISRRCLNEVIAFIIGHETIHACCRIDTSYKNKIVEPIKQQVKYMISVIGGNKRKDFIESLTDQQIEEIACDQKSIFYLYEHYLKNDKTNDIKEELNETLMNIVLMQTYIGHLEFSRLGSIDVKHIFSKIVHKRSYYILYSRLLRFLSIAREIYKYMNKTQDEDVTIKYAATKMIERKTLLDSFYNSVLKSQLRYLCLFDDTIRIIEEDKNDVLSYFNYCSDTLLSCFLNKKMPIFEDYQNND